jgi:hypothetical protein
MSRKITTSDFIDKANIIHNFKYNYSKTNYINATIGVIIICKIHGEFIQKPTCHIYSKCGCTKCSLELSGIKSRLTTDTFINKANIVHNYKYDYSYVIYEKNSILIKIKCKNHGIFMQTPRDHLAGRGCNECGKEIKRHTKINFIKMANEIHNEIYIYDEINYTNMETKIKIICKEHGEFWQTPKTHLMCKVACKACSIREKSNSNESFIYRANIIHNEKYDYSLIKYTNCHTKIEIICKKHGSFWQTPSNHLSPSDCPLCYSSVSKSEIRWLDSLSMPIKYRHASIKINKKIFKFDAFDSDNKIIYEFYGDYWHGNPNKYNSGDINLNNKKTFGELFNKTMERECFLKKNGYQIISIWESDFNESIK